jgi:beta-glucanase (GH16 family)
METPRNWVVDKGNIMNTNTSGGELALLLTKENGGTRISSTRYLHYGTVTTRLKSGRWGGVVVAAITMSSIKDEVDWEFPGNTTTQTQSNYFWQGYIPTDKNNGGIHKNLQDTFGSYHDYTIDWKPKTLTFSIDGKVVRTVQASNTTDPQGVTRYPNTPSRVQISIWPAGIPGVSPGTVEWAGGMINWNNPDYTSAGHFYTLIKSVTVKCGDPETPGPNITSYKYGKNTTLETPEILLSNQTTLLNDACNTFGRTGLQFHVSLLAVAGLLLGSYVL